MPSWDWNEFDSESGVVHESVANADHGNNSRLKQGYQIESPFLDTNLIGYWPLHENSGGTAYDFSSNNNDGTVDGVSQGQTGILGTTAYTFDGTDDTVLMDPANWGPSSFTVAFWLKSTNTDNSLFPFGYATSNTDNEVLWSFDSNSSRVFIGNTQDTGFGTNTFSSGNWEYATLRWRSSDGSFDVYQNASNTGSTTIQSGYSVGSSGALLLGGEQDSVGGDFGNYWAGTINDFRVYDSFLSGSQIQTLYDVVDTPGTWTGLKKTM